MDLDEIDLPNSSLDLFIQEAYDQTIALDARWRYQENIWTLVFTDDGEPVDLLTSGISAVASVADTAYGAPLVHVTHSLAETEFQNTNGPAPVCFSIWGRKLYLWPTQDEEVSVRVRGWSEPADWMAEGASSQPDMHPLLHRPLVHYAVSRVYAQQEDEQLSAFYLTTWMRAVDAVKSRVTAPDYQGPSVMGSGIVVGGRSIGFD